MSPGFSVSNAFKVATCKERGKNVAQKKLAPLIARSFLVRRRKKKYLFVYQGMMQGRQTACAWAIWQARLCSRKVQTHQVADTLVCSVVLHFRESTIVCASNGVERRGTLKERKKVFQAVCASNKMVELLILCDNVNELFFKQINYTKEWSEWWSNHSFIVWLDRMAHAAMKRCKMHTPGSRTWSWRKNENNVGWMCVKIPAYIPEAVSTKLRYSGWPGQ